jgi:hypothetical protein
MARPPRVPIDLQAKTKFVMERVERAILELEQIAQITDPIFVSRGHEHLPPTLTFPQASGGPWPGRVPGLFTRNRLNPARWPRTLWPTGGLCWSLYSECDALDPSRARICFSMERRSPTPCRALRYSWLLGLRTISRLRGAERGVGNWDRGALFLGSERNNHAHFDWVYVLAAIVGLAVPIAAVVLFRYLFLTT